MPRRPPRRSGRRAAAAGATKRAATGAGARGGARYFQALVDQLHDVVYRYRLRPTRAFEYVSPAVTALTGYTPEEHYADPDLGLKIVHPEDRPVLESLLNAQDIRDEPLVLRWVRKDGAVIWTEQRNTPIRDGAGTLVAIQGVARDVSERRRLERALRMHERQTAAIAELGQRALGGAAPEDLMNLAVELVAQGLGTEYAKVLELQPDGRYLLLRAGVGWKPGLIGNATVENTRGSQAGYTLMSHKPVVVEDLGAETRFNPPALLTEHNAVSGISVAIPGREKPYGVLGAHTRNRRHFNEDDIHFMQAIAHILADALDQRHTRDQLRIKDMALVSASHPIVMSDLRARLSYVNRAALELWGYAEEIEVLGRPVGEFVQDPKAAQAAIQALWEAGRWQGELAAKRRDGSAVKLHISAHLVSDAHGRPLCMMASFTDLTAFEKVNTRLRESERRLATLMDNLPGMVYRCRNDPDWTLEFASDGCRALTGYRPEDFISNRITYGQVIHPDDRKRVWRGVQTALREKRAFELSYRIVTAGNELKHVWEQGRGVYAEDGKLLALEGFVTDISERQQAESLARKLVPVVEQTADSVMITDRDGRLEYVNAAFEAITGYRRAEVLGRAPGLLKSGKHDEQFYQQLWGAILAGKTFRAVFVNRRKDGRLYHEDQTITPLTDAAGHITHFVATGRDITERIEAEERLNHLAHHDALTDLPNRLLFMDRLQLALVRAQRHQRLVAVLFMDLDGFKEINDAHGHQTGDELLRAVAARLNECVRQGDTVSRLGGDEFAILLEDLARPEHAHPVAEKTLQAFVQPFAVVPHELALTTSIGISLYPLDGTDAQTLLQRADAAMYRAKERGKNSFLFWSSASKPP